MTAGAGSGYAANLRRMGFAEEEIAQLSDRLVDAVVAWGDLDVVAARIAEHLGAGADQVVLSVVSADPPGSSRSGSGGSWPRRSSPSPRALAFCESVSFVT